MLASSSSDSDDPGNLDLTTVDRQVADAVDNLDSDKQTRQGRDWRPKSTLHLKQFSEMTILEKMAARRLMPSEYHSLKPATVDRGPIPKHPLLPEHLFILSHALLAPALQQLSYYSFPATVQFHLQVWRVVIAAGYKWPPAVAWFVYVASYIFFGNRVFKRFTHFALKYGTLDEKNVGRDRYPDKAIDQLALGQLAFLLTRTFGEFFIKYDRTENPINAFSWTTPIRWFFWLVALDYFFYAYHRTAHEVDLFWRIHKIHHTTRHPSPLLSILSSEIQEVIEIALVPLSATLLVSMNFHELFVLSVYTSYVELLGHTGIRAEWELPITGLPLRLIGCNLLIEDHDTHHRFGKSGRNYGKQSRFWDVLFGTTTDRIEMSNLPGQRPY
ncbi:BQ5605_C024g09831 [Microbotryum silenes-dioicae]|uniref:BQ5605_C024g09831 protein n=1 Tax=Microbotryum silenes-dioicae TaxID=796604 RepID=A0A2X0PL87_9BASI|nr:BQ5605_C024g09831 [Microbotryum silenes-dioicae]